MGGCCYREIKDQHGLDQREGTSPTPQHKPLKVPKDPENTSGTSGKRQPDSLRRTSTHNNEMKRAGSFKAPNRRLPSFKSKRSMPDLQAFPITTKRLKKPFANKFKVVHIDKKAAIGKFLLVKVRNEEVFHLVKKVPRGTDQSPTDQYQETQLRAEVTASVALDHPNILQYREVLYDDQFIYAVAEQAISSQFLLAEEIAGLKEEKLAASVVTQMLEAVSYCHSLGVTHGNIGPHSLLYIACDKESILVKITGFGVSPLEKFANDPRNTYMYSAPEALAHEIQQKSDVWSCGVLLYYLLCANLPFRADRINDFKELVENYAPLFSQQYWTKAGSKIRELILAMLKSDVNQRFSASDCLAHSWLQQRSASATSVTKPISTALNNLKYFSGGLRLKFTVLSFVAAQVTTAEQKQELIDVFRSIDFDHDGVLNTADLTKAYSLLVHQTVAELIAKRVIERVDLDADGSIDFSEFMVAASDHRSLLTSDNLLAVFDVFDVDKSGAVSLAEMKETLKSEESEDHWNELMAEADENGDGVVNFKEFSALVKKAAGEGKTK